MQTILLPEIDRVETKRNVDQALEKYQIMLLMEPEEFEPKVTASFQLAPSGPTNEFSSTTESIAIKRVESESMRRDYIDKITKAVNRLRYQERNILIKRYLTDEEVYDYEVYNELGFSESKYYRIKSDAFYRLAFALRIVAYKEVDNE